MFFVQSLWCYVYTFMFDLFGVLGVETPGAKEQSICDFQSFSQRFETHSRVKGSVASVHLINLHKNFLIFEGESLSSGSRRGSSHGA